MARDYSAEYERRDELAQERGFDSFYEERSYREDAREFLDDRGIDYDRDDVLAYAQFDASFVEGEWERDDLQEWFFEHFPDADMNDFWDWLDELYGQ